jgi:hypothetical protein
MIFKLLLFFIVNLKSPYRSFSVIRHFQNVSRKWPVHTDLKFPVLRNWYMTWGKKFKLNWYYVLPITLNKLLQCANTLCSHISRREHVNVYLDILHVFLNSFLYNLKSIQNFGMKFGGNVDWLYLILIEYRF